MNLLEEYNRRHGVTAIPPVDEGVLFFNAGKAPAAVCLTSSPTRHHTTCRRCVDQGSGSGLVVELFVPDKSGNNPWSLAGHSHLDPDCDLRAHVEEVLGRKVEPVVVSDNRQVEAWLWRFFTKSVPPSHTKWESRDEVLRAFEQMVWTVQKQPARFGLFYRTCYPLVLNRKYLLYG